MYKEIFLLKEGEIALKGLNRKMFEDVLLKNLRRRLKHLGEFEYNATQSTITITPISECDMDEVARRIKTVYGIVSFSKVAVCEKDLVRIKEMIKIYLNKPLSTAKTFKVQAKRSDKKFPLNSPEIAINLGETILNDYKHLKVDLINPDVRVIVEVRDVNAYIYSQKEDGAGGIPVGVSGEGMLLISGGIDSPVAGCMMAKRGLKLSAIHFVSPPYTSQRALDKVEKLLSIISRYCGDIMFYVINFTKIQVELKKNCREEYFTILMRRMMVRITDIVSDNILLKSKSNIECMVTGESLGQVASQTLKGIVSTDIVAKRPILRPQIGMDKEEIVKLARKLNTFETSILPYEDCCTVFTPKHPKTKPNLEDIEFEERKIEIEKLIEDVTKDVEFKIIKPDFII